MSHNLLEAFQAAVLLGAERPAIITPARTLSYGELDRLSDKWAGALQQQPRAQIGARVAIALPNGIESVIAMWAAIKSGLVLLPIDLKWPAAGIQRVLSEVEPAIWIGENLPPDSGALTPFTPAELCQSTHVFEPRPLAPDRMLALFYTSGSSGEPKAVALDQDCLWHGAKNYHRALALSPEDRVSWTAPFAYGAAIGVTLPTLTIGAALIPWQPTEHPVAEWIEWLKTCRVSVIMIVTSLFRTIASHLPDGENLPHLRLIKIGGEAAHPGDAELFARRFHHDCALINGLGITEIGANVCFHTWARGSAIPPPTLPLGHAAAGIELLIADENGNLLPAGGEGEILVRSKWMARGYWTRSGIINERFAPLPDDTTPTYRTGDLGRILPDGSLQHLGSLSTQLKIRGYRVEAIEVESAIRSLSGINEAAVNVRTWSDAPKLVAWITGPDADQWTATHIRKELRSRLADYMLPTLVCALPELPKSINGKIDRKALAESPLKVHARSQTIDDPLERQIGKIWEKLLGIQGIGRTDNFFDLGGDSLMAMSLLNQLERKLGVELPMIHISNCPTIELMAGQVRTNAAPSQRAILLEAGNDTTTVFCIPGAGLDVSTLMELASHLAPVASVYGLQLPGLDGFSNPAPTVEAMAAQFLPEVLRIQPVGPYHFIGISFGGRVAVELVQLLLERGEQVTTLAFADTFGPGIPTLRPGLSLLRRLRARWLLFAGEGPRWRLRHYRRILKRLREIVLLLRASRWLRQGRPIERMPRKLRPFYSFRLAREASRAHRPGPVGVPVILFIPEVELENPDFEMTNDRGWAPIATAGLKIIRMPGKHATMFRNPHAEILASHLAAHIANGFSRLRFRSAEIAAPARRG